MESAQYLLAVIALCLTLTKFKFYNIIDQSADVKLSSAEDYLAAGLKPRITQYQFSEIIRLPGVSEKLAPKLLEFKADCNTDYRADLLKIKGIGEKTFEKINNYIDFCDKSFNDK